MAIKDPYTRIVAKSLECREAVKEAGDPFVSYLLEMLLEAAVKKADIREIEALTHDIYNKKMMAH